MRDPRFDRLAELVLDHSLSLRPGQVLRIDAPVVAEPLIVALHRAAVTRGAHSYADVEIEGLKELLVEEGSDDQLSFVSPIGRREAETIDALVTIWSDSNTRSFSRVDPARYQLQINAERQLSLVRRGRIERGELVWCGTLSPTAAHAQDAGLSLDEYEDFVFRACHVHDADPAGYWRSLADELELRARQLQDVRELRIVGDGTDLTVGVAGRTWRASNGLHNMPDGEVYTSPLETSASGTVAFGFPAVYGGREIDGVRLRFEDGRVVEQEARVGRDYLDALLELDEGARTLGEVAFGLNYEIDRFTRNILFDEKIGGTMHLALGLGFEDLGGQNVSTLHLDLICDLRAEGEVYGDGELIWRRGRFLEAAQTARPVEHVG